MLSSQFNIIMLTATGSLKDEGRLDGHAIPQDVFSPAYAIAQSEHAGLELVVDVVHSSFSGPRQTHFAEVESRRARVHGAKGHGAGDPLLPGRKSGQNL